MKQTLILALLGFLAVGCGSRKTYSEGCGQPPAGWIKPRDGRSVLSLLSTVSVAGDGKLFWNGVKITEPKFISYLKATRGLNPAPITHIKFDPAVDCQSVIRLRKLMSQNLDCTYGLCAEGSGKWWLVGDVMFEGQPPEPYLPGDATKP